MRKGVLALIAIAGITLSGCGITDMIANSIYKTEPEPIADIATLGFVPNFEYEYTQQTPAVITDRIGYIPSGKKVIYIEGNDLDKHYKLVSSDGEETVFEGKLRKVSGDEKSKDGEKNLYIGDFSEFNQSGEFRIYQSDVGYSHKIHINNTCYSSIYSSCYDTIVDAEYMHTDALVYTLSNLIFTKEIYSNARTNDAFIKGGIEVLLEQQHPRLGALYKELQDEQTLNTIAEELKNPMSATIQTDEMISPSATAQFAGLMAQYYHEYREAEPELAITALRAGGRAYNYMERYRDEVSADSLYYAAAQLYRATGESKYRNAIAEYDNIEESKRDISKYDFTMLGDVAYLGSAYKTDYIRCENLMKSYRGKAAKISESATRQTYYVQPDIKDLSEDEILRNMMTLGLVSYILSGREYASVQSNYLHYLFGLNGDMANYFVTPMEDGGMPLSTDIVSLSRLIFILGNGE